MRTRVRFPPPPPNTKPPLAGGFLFGGRGADETLVFRGRDSIAQGCAGAAKGRTPESGPPPPPIQKVTHAGGLFYWLCGLDEIRVWHLTIIVILIDSYRQYPLMFG